MAHHLQDLKGKEDFKNEKGSFEMEHSKEELIKKLKKLKGLFVEAEDLMEEINIHLGKEHMQKDQETLSHYQSEIDWLVEWMSDLEISLDAPVW